MRCVHWALTETRSLTVSERLVLVSLSFLAGQGKHSISVELLAQYASLKSKRSVSNVLVGLIDRGLIECPSPYADVLDFELGPAVPEEVRACTS